MFSAIASFLKTPYLLDSILLGLSILLVTAILLQSQGTGLSGSFGGEGNVYRTKRGVEKVLFSATIVIAVLFFAVALLDVLF